MMKLKYSIEESAAVLKQGGLVAFPTETVYGLGADATQETAIRKVFAAKGRPIDHPLIVHVADFAALFQWAVELSPMALALAKVFWPGPLTLIVKKAPFVSDLITGGQDTVGIRCPNHSVALKLIKQLGNGIVGPSANRFGRISPTTADAVYEELGEKVDIILAGGRCQVGVESTIVDTTKEHPRILRPGAISYAEIEKVLGTKVLMKERGSTAERVSGAFASHYAPLTPAKLIFSREKWLAYLTADNLPQALLTREKIMLSPDICVIQMPLDARAYAHQLYATLRFLDQKNMRQIVIEAVPDESEWDAVRDRLSKICS